MVADAAKGECDLVRRRHMERLICPADEAVLCHLQLYVSVYQESGAEEYR